MKSTAVTLTVLTAISMLGACDGNRNEEAPPPPVATPSAIGTESILRPDVEAETEIEQDVPPLNESIGFADGGSELSAAAQAQLDGLLEQPQFAESWPITLGGHSDAGGNDEVNTRISRERAQAVAAYLIGRGIADDRITIIAFGEQNPVAPNALPDGETNERGRARNRRVDLMIAEPGGLPLSGEPAAGEATSISDNTPGQTEN